MKKFLSRAILFVLIVCMLCVATACSFGDPFKELSKEVEESNYKISMTMRLENVGTVTQVMYCDGNVSYYPENTMLQTQEYYTEKIDEYTVEYRTNENGKWTKSISEDETLLNLDENEIFDKDNYEKSKDEKNVYVQKKNVIFENFENVVISFFDDSVVLECTMRMELVECEVKMVISEFGEQELTLPSVKS